MDSHAFASLAHVRILLLPVGSIQQSAFDKFAAEIRAFDDIRLGDIPADQKDERARFMPNPLATGHLHLSFPSHPPPTTHSALGLFRPSHFPLGVIGIGVCSPTESLSSILDQFNTSLLDIFPASSLFPLAKNCFVFEENDSNPNLNFGDNLPSLVVIPSMMGNRKLYVGTLLADLCSHILGEFGRVVQALENPFGNEYLNSTLFPPMPVLSEMPRQFDDGFQVDSLPPLPSHSSQPDMGVSTGRAQTNLKRNSSTGHGLSNAINSSNVRQSTLVVPAAKSKRNSGIGVSSPPGRLFKVLGDFFLLSGRIDDAIVWYTESIIVLKTAQDSAWHASALEGLATAAVIESWLAGHGLAGSFSNTKEPWIDVSEKLAQATALYYKTTPPLSESEQNHFYLSYLHSTSAIRHASLFFSIWSAKGWGPLAFTAMLQPGISPYLPPTLSHPEHNTWVNLERLSLISGISRSMVAGLLAQAHGPWLLHLGPRERLEILETMAAIYACLGYKRKEAYVLREVLGCVMDLLVCGREESRGSVKQTSSSSGTGLGIRGVDFGDKSPGAERGNVGVRANDSVEGNESILRLLKYVCRVLGIDLEAVKLVNAGSDEPSTVDEEEESRSTAPSLHLDDDIWDVSRDIYGWPELQVGVVREAIAVAESLPDYPTVAQISLSALKTMHLVLTPGDQHHLYTTSVRALATAQRRGDMRQVEYWAGRPIISIAVSPLPFVRLPIEKQMSVLTARLSGINPILTGATDPFLYNPRKSSTTQGKTLVVQNEPVELIVTLRNPFVFDLDIQYLALSTSGVPFDAKNVSVVIPASSYRVVSIVGKPLSAGNLVFRGCIVQAPGGTSREFVLPLSTDDEEDRLSRRRSALECETGRSKYSGLDSRPWERTGKRVSASMVSSMKPSRFLECKVVPEQPLLRIRRTSLTHGAVMMYNGEMSTVRLTLENVSTLPIDFLRLSFDDSTIGPAQQALADGQLSVFDTYETEYDLIHRPTFTWQSQEQFKELAPGQKVVVTVACFGKVGCTSGTIFVAYSYMHRPIGDAELPSEVFYTRQLTYPVLVTVYHMLECHGMDILPFDGIDTGDSTDEEIAHAKSPLLSINEAGWCLFSVEVRNTYGLPFEVTFERNQEGTQKASTSLVVPPGSMSRIVLPLKRFLLPEEQVSQPIPTLSDRQFVVTKSKLSSAEEKNQRELFWYREELFKNIRGHWLEVGGTRTGDLSLRQQRMTLPMLETIRTETARVMMSLIEYDDDDNSGRVITHKGGKYLPRPNEFVYVRTRVINLSSLPLVLTINLKVDPADHIIYDGVLSNIPLGRIESGETGDVETAVCFLSQGRFEIFAEVQILDASRSERKAGRGQLEAIVREET